MDGNTVYVAAVVKQTSKNRFYLHEVVDSNGNVIKIDSRDGANQTSLATEGDAGTQSPLSSDNSIPQNIQNVNTNNGIRAVYSGRGDHQEGTYRRGMSGGEVSRSGEYRNNYGDMDYAGYEESYPNDSYSRDSYPRSEMRRRGGAASSRPFTMADAQEWVGKMENEDGTHGAHWTIDQVKQVIAQKKLDCDPVQMWAAMNMVYSDYCKVAKKHGVGGNLDFYVDMAKAFLDDKDAGPSKISAYYEYVVNGEK